MIIVLCIIYYNLSDDKVMDKTSMEVVKYEFGKYFITPFYRFLLALSLGFSVIVDDRRYTK